MPVFVNQSKTAALVGCSRNNFSKMWRKEKELPGQYSFFSDSGKIDISDPEFIDSYGDHVAEWNSMQEPAAAAPKEPVQPAKPPAKKRGRPPGSTNKKKQEAAPAAPADPPPKERTEKQKEQDRSASDRENESLSSKALREKAVQAKYTSQILSAQKADMELKKARGELVEIETLGETCIGYLSALNQNIMECPASFLDEMEAAMIAKKTRSEKLDILRKPICDSISETITLIEKELKNAKRKAR